MRQHKNPWANAHIRLKRLYEARVPEGVTQKDFGQLHGIGSQSMVAQYLNGIRPLNYETAAKFAKGLGCTIYEICPEMGDSIKTEILPFLGKALRRAAVLILACALQQLVSFDAKAFSHKTFCAHNVNLIHIVRGYYAALRKWLSDRFDRFTEQASA